MTAIKNSDTCQETNWKLDTPSLSSNYFPFWNICYPALRRFLGTQGDWELPERHGVDSLWADKCCPRNGCVFFVRVACCIGLQGCLLLICLYLLCSKLFIVWSCHVRFLLKFLWTAHKQMTGTSRIKKLLLPCGRFEDDVMKASYGIAMTKHFHWWAIKSFGVDFLRETHSSRGPQCSTSQPKLNACVKSQQREQTRETFSCILYHFLLRR